VEGAVLAVSAAAYVVLPTRATATRKLRAVVLAEAA
jgi:hypothetical protein